MQKCVDRDWQAQLILEKLRARKLQDDAQFSVFLQKSGFPKKSSLQILWKLLIPVRFTGSLVYLVLFEVNSKSCFGVAAILGRHMCSFKK